MYSLPCAIKLSIMVLSHILSWNANLVGHAKQAELREYLRVNNVLVAHISESQEHLHAIPEFSPYAHLTTRDSLLLIHPTVSFELFHTIDEDDAEAFVVKLPLGIFTFAYCRNGSRPSGISKVTSFASLSQTDYLMGDLNARLDASNSAGSFLLSWMEAHFFLSLNLDNMPTYTRSDKGPPTLDHCLVRFNKFDPHASLTTDSSLRSDHSGLLLLVPTDKIVFEASLLSLPPPFL